MKPDSDQGRGQEGRYPAADILDVVHEVRRSAIRLSAYRPALAAEKDFLDPAKEANRAANLKDAIKKYKDALAGLDPGQTFAQRQVEYKNRGAAQPSRRAMGKPKPEAALLQMRDFKNKHPNSWQITSA